jgi:hypothetical protein
VASIGALIIDLVAKTAGFETDLGRAARTAEKRSKEIERSVSRLQSKITSGLAGLIGAFSFAKIIKATSEAEKALAALDNAVRNNAGAAGASTQQLADFSGELQKLTTFSDDSIQGMQALLLSFRQIGGNEFKRAQVAVLDLATALGKDLNSSALLVGRALADPVKGMTALGRAGVVLSKEQQGIIKSLVQSGRAAEAQAIILRELEKRYGGAAEAARNTFGGALAGLKNAFDDLLEVKGGLPGSIEAINELSSLLQDPATKSGIDAITSALISGFAGAAKAIAQTAGGIRVLAENLAAARYGAAADDLVRLNEQLVLAQNIKLGKESRLRFFGKGGIVEWFDDAELDSEIKSLQQQIKRGMDNSATPLGGAPGGGLGTGGAADDLPPSEEFTKLAAKLKEQIALHGKVGEAAKLAYAIQSGALEELSDSEEKQLLALARRADAVTANTEAQKAAAEAQKKALDDQVKANESITSLVLSLQQQVATFEQGETATIRYRIAHGDLAETFKIAGENADAYKDTLISLTQQLELMTESAQAANAAIIETTSDVEDDLGRQADEFFKKFEKPEDSFGEQFKDAMFGALADGIETAMTDGAKKGWKGFLDAGFETINRLVAVALAKKLAESLFGGAGASAGGGGSSLVAGGFDIFKYLAGLWGGGKAYGGPVSAGTMYRVNEREPEFFKPNVGGRVVPLSKMPEGGGLRVTQNINVQGTPTTRTATQLQVEAARRQRIATARLG